MVLWGGSKALTLWMNSGNTEQTVSKFTEVLKLYCVLTDRQFWASRMEMRHMSQRPGETFQDYLARVITLGDLCKWSNRDEQIVCSLIFGANHHEAQRKALNKPRDLSVKDCIDHFVSFEATDNYHKSINTSVTVNSVQKKQYYNDNQSLSNKPTFIKNCYACGKSHNRGRSHHYESVSRNKQYNKKQFSSQRNKPLQNKYKPKVDLQESSKEDYFCHSVHVKHRKTLPKNYPHAIKQSKWENVKKNGDELVKLKFEGTNLGALATIDTGADVSVMPVRIYRQLYPHNMTGEIVQGLKPCNMKLTAFNNTNINVIGQICLKTKHRDVVKTITFIITNVYTVTIIGRTDAVDLKCIQFLWDRYDQCKNDSSFVKSANITFNGRVAKKSGQM